MSSIFPIPQTFGLVDQGGFATVQFKLYLDSLLARVGGIQGGSSLQLPINTGTVIWDLNQTWFATVVLNQNITIPSPLNLVAGPLVLYRITLVQDAVGSRLVTWGSAYKFPSGTAPVLSTAANAVDEILFDCDGTNMRYIAGAKDIR